MPVVTIISASNNKKFEQMLLIRCTTASILYAYCLGLSPVISAKTHFLNVRRSLKTKI